MKTIILRDDPLPENESTITLDFLDPKEITRGTQLAQRKALEGKITFNPEACQIFVLSSHRRELLSSQQERKQWDFYLISIPFTLHKEPETAGSYQEVTFLIEIEDQKTLALDLFPKQINVETGAGFYTLSSDLKITEESKVTQPHGLHIHFPKLQPTITAFGEGEPTLYWVYETSPEQKGVTAGSKHTLILLQTPHGTRSVTANISYEAVIARQWAGKWKSYNRETKKQKIHWDLMQAIQLDEAISAQAPGPTPARQAGSAPHTIYDVCVACALADEARAFMQIAEYYYGLRFEKAFDRKLKLEYYYTQLLNNQEEPLRLQLSWPARYGPLEIGLHLQPLYEVFQPRFTAMTGICAGDEKLVRRGDLIIAERAYFYDTGKIKRAPDGKRIQQFNVELFPARSAIVRFIQTFDYERFLERLRSWKSIAVSSDPQCHIGVMASGSAVRADHLFEEPLPVRNTLAVDMEGAAFYRTAMDFPGMYALLAKGVSDFADSNKNDLYRHYSSALSAMYMLSFIKEYVTLERMPNSILL